jgi:hypothetical protein
MSGALPNTIKFSKIKDFMIKGVTFATGIEFVSVSDPETRDALINNKPFPKEARLLDIKVKGEAGHDVGFLGKRGNVSFSGKGDVFAGLGVYLSPEKLIADLQLDDEIEAGFETGGVLNEYLLALRWGYDLDGKAEGSIALGAAGSVTFGGEVQRDAAYAVVRRFPQKTNAYTAVQALANSWILPTHVDSVGKLDPGTWLIAEVSGSVAANIGVTYGLNFNWVRDIKEAGLSGDIGLHLQLGLEATLGFNSSGRYAVVLGRPSADEAEKKVRLRIFKQRKKGWDFAFSAGATVQAEEGFIPGKYDDLIGAVFGVHGAQIVKGLETFDRWTNTEQTLPEILAGAGLDEARKLLEAVTGKDPVAEFDAAKKKVVDFLDEWASLDKLNHRVSTLIWKVVGEIEKDADLDDELAKIREIAEGISSLNLDKVKSMLEEKLKDVDFSRTPVGKWLESLAGGAILRALNSNEEFTKLQKAAAATVRVLDGGPVQDVLKKLQDYIEKNLGEELKKLEEIKQKITDADLAGLNKWLAARLKDFLGKDVGLDTDKLEQIRLSLQTIRKKSQSLYEAGIKALNRKYEFNYSYTYQSATTKTALLDVVFDCGVAGAEALLPPAVDGEFDRLLIDKAGGVELREAHLTHQIDRNSHTSISTPFFKRDVAHSNKSFADYTPAEQDGEILMTYSLDAKDIVTVKNKLTSQIAVAGFLQGTPNNNVNVHSKDELTYAYSFRQAKTDMGRAALEYQLRPYVGYYFKNAFSTQTGSTASASFPVWLTNLDIAVDHALDNGPDKFGDTLLSLQLSVPAVVSEAWLDAPRDEKSDVYMNMSLQLQETIKFLVRYLYLQDPKRFKEMPSLSGVLAYGALPPSTRITGIFPDIKFDTRTGVYWDYMNPSYYEFMLDRPETVQRLAGILAEIQSSLKDTPELKDLVDNYDPKRAGVFMSNARNNPFGIANLKALLNFESTVISGAVKAGVAMAKFREDSPNKPADAIEDLAEFGSKLTETFNKSLSSLHGGDKSRPMATLLFVEAARALRPSLSTATDAATTALLELIVLKKDSPFKARLADYIAGELPAKDDTLIEQRIVSLK